MKQLLTLFIFIFYTSLTFAQSSDNEADYINPEWKQSGDVQYGLLLGYTSNTLSDDGDFDPDDPSGNGFLVGGQAELFLGKNWSLRGRLTYEQRDFGFLGLEDNYIALAAMPAWHFGKNRRWHLQLGPAYSANLGDTLESGLGIDFGIGVIIPIAGARFFIELDGLTQPDIIETTITDINGNPIGTSGLDGNRSSFTIGLLF